MKDHLKYTSDIELIDIAKGAKEYSYSPYSTFKVGAAIVADDGNIYTGCNIENASYGLTVCAERAAIFKAISSGGKRIKKIAISCQDGAAKTNSSKMPCGACLQVISEFAEGNIDILIDGIGHYKLSDLLPKPFKL